MPGTALLAPVTPISEAPSAAASSSRSRPAAPDRSAPPVGSSVARGDRSRTQELPSAPRSRPVRPASALPRVRPARPVVRPASSAATGEQRIQRPAAPSRRPSPAPQRPRTPVEDTSRIEPASGAIDGIPVPRSFLRNEQELRPVKSGSSRAKVVRVRQAERPERKSRRGGLVRGAAGVTAIGFAASVAVASTIPANASSSSSVSEDTVADANLMTGAQELTVSGVAPQGQNARPDSFAVATLGSATAANLASGLPDAGAYRNDLTGTVQWPFPVGVKITDFFGSRVAPCASCSSDHKGVDFAPAEGTPIGAIAAGRVITAHQTDNGGLGVYVEVEHFIDGERVVSVYAHMLVGSIAVKPGQIVNVGDELGKVGNTGSSTGAHLHLEVHIGGVKVDPKAFIESKNKPDTVVTRPDAGASA
ncbi:MAG: peptidoglycan DD-metalloendopeptidase family protein [Pseudoclavibacter sp.]|nr:peptidoglycan DD-metalloendopeptidase family protein [Pseudoclavibacter sp.]